MPVGIVSGEAGYLQAHNDPRASHANIGHQVLEASCHDADAPDLP